MFATLGARLYLGDVMLAPDQDLGASDFTAVTWTEIGGITNLGRTGLKAEVERFAVPDCNEPDRPPRMRKDIASVDGGTMTVLADLSHEDAGQQLIWSSVGKESRAVRLVLPPSPSIATQQRLLVAYVVGADEQWNDANSIMQLQIELEIDSNVVRATV